MEQLLCTHDQVCLVCRTPLKFRLSRFGCVFVCARGCTLLDGQRAVKKYYDTLLQHEMSPAPLPFLPRIELAAFSTRDVAEAKVVSVEIDCELEKALVSLENFHGAEGCALLASLSHALTEQLQKERAQNGSGNGDGSSTEAATFAFPLGTVDVLTDELASLAEAPVGRFILSLPPPQLLSALHRASGSSAAEAPNEALQMTAALERVLRQHQLAMVRQALRWQGRILIADDMGVGKTLEALGTIAALKAYPLLIVTPSALKYMWAEEVEKYLHEQVGVNDIHIISGSNDALSADSSDTPKVVITSFHMAATLGLQLRARMWKGLLVDESHTLHTNAKGTDARYTELLVALGKNTPCCLLLSGTPALTSPFDMFNQLDMLRPGLLGETRWHFALRYCRLRMTPYLHVSECIRPREFASLLRSLYMVRRLKRDVLELPAKTRVILKVTANVDREVGAQGMGTSREDGGGDLFQRQYSRCWQLKRRGIFEAVAYVCEKYPSVVLFAHHIALLDALAAYLASAAISFVRIDGSVDVQARSRLVQRFCHGEVRVAVMGITACAVGISLASAQCAVFCELPPDAAWMVQAEDRLHRYGQENEVSVYYLLGIHLKFDTRHFTELCQSFDRVRRVTDDAPSDLNFGHASRGQRPVVRPTERSGEGAGAGDSAGRNEARVPPARGIAFLFAVSRNTQRIHVKAAGPASRDAKGSAALSFYESFSPEESVACVRNRSSPVWEQLSTFVERFAQLSPFHQRRLVSLGQWLPCDFAWPSATNGGGGEMTSGGGGGSGGGTAGGKRNRYQRSALGVVLRPSLGSADRGKPAAGAEGGGIGWGFWWKVSRPGLPVHFYFAQLRRPPSSELCPRGESLEARCLYCLRPLPCPTLATEVGRDEAAMPLRPGSVVTVNTDTVMFCRGACREAFFIRRSGGAVRRSVLRADRGVCSNCHVDCRKLSAECQSLGSVVARELLVRRDLPHLEGFPVLFRTFVRNPLPGNLWHADHVVPVGLGGGEATLNNLQTLCVACHALKTQEDLKAIRTNRAEATAAAAERRAIREGNEPQQRATTLAAAQDRLMSTKQRRRVTGHL